MKLSPQKKKLYDLFKSGEWVCSNEIAPLYIRDYRKRISEMRREGFTFESMVCDCSRPHSSGVHKYRLVYQPQEPPKPIFQVQHPFIPGKMISSTDYAKL